LVSKEVKPYMVQQCKPKDSNIVFNLSLIGFFGIFSTTISKNPVLPYLTKSLGGDDQLLGLIAAISPLAGIMFSFPVGILADKMGKKPMLIISAFVFLTAPLLYIFLTDAWFLIPVRFFHGIATAILGPVASAIIASNYSTSKGEKLGIYSSVTLIGRTIAPLTGGFVIALFASYGEVFSYKAVYMLAFVVSIPIVVLALSVSTCDKKESKRFGWRDFLTSLLGVIRSKSLFAIALVDLSAYFSFGIFETFTPGYLKSIGYSPKIVGLLFSIQVLSIALTKPLFGRLADRVDKRVQIAFGLGTIGLAIASLTFVSSIALITGASLLLGLGMSIATVATSAYVADIAKKDELGASMGALGSIMDIGHSTGPLVAGIIISTGTIHGGYLAGAVLAAVVLVVFLLVTVNSRETQ
jgi:MFS transporter, DHA1 family, multidrug resistance protein